MFTGPSIDVNSSEWPAKPSVGNISPRYLWSVSVLQSSNIRWFFKTSGGTSTCDSGCGVCRALDWPDSIGCESSLNISFNLSLPK